MPSKYEVHEYEIMERFALSITSEEISDTLYDALKSRGVLWRFKDLVAQHNLFEQWYQYRDNAYRKIAIA